MIPRPRGWRRLFSRKRTDGVDQFSQTDPTVDLVRASGHFDVEWYIAQNPDVAAAAIDPCWHYTHYGWAEGREPGPKFNGSLYLEAHADAATSGLNPLVHYLTIGAKDGRPLYGAPLPPISASIRGTPSIAFIIGESRAGGRAYRINRAIQAARAAGYDAFSVLLQDVPLNVDRIAASSAVVIWRAAFDHNVETVLAAARKGRARVVFDCDDMMVDPSIAHAGVIDAIRSNGKNAERVQAHYRRVQRTLRSSAYAIATTEPLAAEMRRQGIPTFVIPNTFDEDTTTASRLAVRTTQKDGLVRIGYAAGTPTHQKDFSQAAPALADVLRQRPNCRVVLFLGSDGRPLVNLSEFPEFSDLTDQIEWRARVPLNDLPGEMARFDISIAPLEAGNVFCEAKSELKYFEAALVDVPTVASPTDPYRRAIEHGRTGYLATTHKEWRDALLALVDDEALRCQIGRAAYLDALWRFGPRRRTELTRSVFEQIIGTPRQAARAFELEAARLSYPPPTLKFAPSEVIFEHDNGRASDVTVVIPSYNYSHFLPETLDSAARQTLDDIDLVIVDDHSTDDSLSVAKDWLERNHARFNRTLLLRNVQNSGLGASRNVGFNVAETPWIMTLDADNRLLPECCLKLLRAAKREHSEFAYCYMQQFWPAAGFSDSQLS